MHSTKSGFLSVYTVMLPKILTATDSMLCTVPASYVHALNLPWGPTHPLLSYTPSISINTNSAGDIHDASGFIPPHILHHHLPTLDLARGIIHGTF